METKKNKIGIIGLGGMGKRHCEAVAALPNCELTAVCDRHQDEIDKVSNKWKVGRGYQSWEQLLKNEQLDLLIVATNGPSHAEISLAAMEVGIPRILCEKPMATSLKSAHQMLSTAQTKKVRLAVNHIRRWTSVYTQLQKQIQEGIIGPIRHILFEMGGGQLASNGGHFWDLARFLTGKEASRIIGFLDKTNTPHPRGQQYNDPGAYGILWLQDETKVFFNMSENYGTTSYVEILGSIGRILIDERINRYEIWARKPEDRNQPMTRRPDLIRIPFEGFAIDMVDCSKKAIQELLNDQPISSTIQDGLASLEISVGAHYSETSSNSIVSFPLSNEWITKEFSFT